MRCRLLGQMMAVTLRKLSASTSSILINIWGSVWGFPSIIEISVKKFEIRLISEVLVNPFTAHTRYRVFRKSLLKSIVFFHELEVISACFPVDMSAMTGAQRPVADDTLLKKLWMSFLLIQFLASGLNKKMEIIQTIDIFVHFIYLHQKTAAHWKFLREKMFPP
jgi:hypothetical protein